MRSRCMQKVSLMKLPRFMPIALLPFTLATSLAAAQPAGQSQPGSLQVQYRTDPCRDGRYNDGRARSCGELLDWLDWQRVYEDRRVRVNPCTDGRFSDGHPHTCAELLDRFDAEPHGERAPRLWRRWK
jgi:hypothetical protein